MQFWLNKLVVVKVCDLPKGRQTQEMMSKISFADFKTYLWVL